MPLLNFTRICGTSQCFLFHIKTCMKISSSSMENEVYTLFRLSNFLNDPCLTSRKSYAILVWLPRVHTNHVRPGMVTRNHIWPCMTTKKFVWQPTRSAQTFYWWMVNFRIIQDKLSELYDLNIIIRKNNWSYRNLKYSGNAMFQNGINFLPLKWTGSAQKWYETQVRELDVPNFFYFLKKQVLTF